MPRLTWNGLVLFRPVVALKLIPLPSAASLGSYIEAITTVDEEWIKLVTYLEIFQHDVAVEAIDPSEYDILAEIDAFGSRELHSMNVQVLTLEAPGEVLPRDHGGGELPKGVLISDIERRRRVDVRAFLRAFSVERVHVHVPQMDEPLLATGVLVDPRHVHRFGELDLGVEDTRVSDYGFQMKLETKAGVTTGLNDNSSRKTYVVF